MSTTDTSIKLEDDPVEETSSTSNNERNTTHDDNKTTGTPQSVKTPKSTPSIPDDSDTTIETTAEDPTDTEHTEHSTTSLMDAKDRAQVTATGALSLTLVVILKNLLISGDATRFYYLSLTLVSASLALQVIIGLLSLIMYSLKAGSSPRGAASKLTASNSGVKYSETIFRPLDETETVVVVGGQDNEAFEGSMAEPKQMRKPFTTADLFRDFRGLDSNAKPWYMRAFPCCDIHEKDLIQRYTMDQAQERLYDILRIERLRASLEYAEAKIRTNGGHKEQEQAAEYRRKTLGIVAAQQKILGALLDSQKKRSIINRITFVQQTITYLYYAVFLLNVFLTGFGVVTSPQTESSPDNTTTI